MQKLIAVAVLVFAACGTDSVALDNYPSGLRDALCSFGARCGDFDSAATCHTTNIGLDLFVSASEQAAIDSGKAKFDGANAQSCLDAVAARSCDLTSQSARATPNACVNIFHGTLHDAAACAVDIECISQFCNRPSCNMACCPGTCVGDVAPVRAKVGQSCAALPCDDQSFCDMTSTCVALKKTGQLCTAFGECDFGLECVDPGMCAALPKLGEPCTNFCRDEGTTCSSTSQTCVKVAVGGQACNTIDDCSLFYFCDSATKKCTAGLALGAACTTMDLCADDLAFCDVAVGASMGVCSKPKALGGSCGGNAECQSHACDLTSGTCVAEPVCKVALGAGAVVGRGAQVPAE